MPEHRNQHKNMFIAGSKSQFKINTGFSCQFFSTTLTAPLELSFLGLYLWRLELYLWLWNWQPATLPQAEYWEFCAHHWVWQFRSSVVSCSCLTVPRASKSTHTYARTHTRASTHHITPHHTHLYVYYTFVMIRFCGLSVCNILILLAICISEHSLVNYSTDCSSVHLHISAQLYVIWGWGIMHNCHQQISLKSDYWFILRNDFKTVITISALWFWRSNWYSLFSHNNECRECSQISMIYL